MKRYMLAAAVGLALAQTRAAGQNIYPLPPLGAGNQSFAQSINPTGNASMRSVVGYSSDGITGVPVYWRLSTPTLLPLPAGADSGAANAITSSNLIAGYVQPPDQSTATAAVWSNPGSWSVTPLPSPANTAMTAAYALNSAGVAAGFSVKSDGHSIATAWTPSGGSYLATMLPPVPGKSDSAATAINEDGDIAGYGEGLGGVQAAVWLNTASGYQVKSVISSGQTLVTSMNQYGTGAGVYAGNKPLVMVYFEGDFYGGELSMPYDATDGASNAVNSSDVIVGYVKDPDTPTSGKEAALWWPGETQWDYYNLDRWLDENSPEFGPLWTLTDASGISDDMLVVGNGLYDADGAGPGLAVERGFVLAPIELVPEPSFLAMLFSLPLLLRRCRG